MGIHPASRVRQDAPTTQRRRLRIFRELCGFSDRSCGFLRHGSRTVSSCITKRVKARRHTPLKPQPARNGHISRLGPPHTPIISTHKSRIAEIPQFLHHVKEAGHNDTYLYFQEADEPDPTHLTHKHRNIRTPSNGRTATSDTHFGLRPRTQPRTQSTRTQTNHQQTIKPVRHAYRTGALATTNVSSSNVR